MYLVREHFLGILRGGDCGGRNLADGHLGDVITSLDW